MPRKCIAAFDGLRHTRSPHLRQPNQPHYLFMDPPHLTDYPRDYEPFLSTISHGPPSSIRNDVGEGFRTVGELPEFRGKPFRGPLGTRMSTGC